MSDHPVDAVEDEMARQAEIDRLDADPSAKVKLRDDARDELEERTGARPDPGPNPS